MKCWKCDGPLDSSSYCQNPACSLNPAGLREGNLLSDREVTRVVLDALVEAAKGVATRRDRDAFIAIRIDAEGGTTIACRFARLYFASTADLAFWLVQQSRQRQPEAALAAPAA